MSKITIIEGNSDDKDQVRNYMVSGLPGISPVIETEKVGDTATITITDVNGEHEVELKDGVSPTITSSKTGKVTTLTIVDAEGTHTATINDGEDGATANIIDDESLSDITSQTYSGRIIDEKLAATFLKENIAVIEQSVTIPSGSYEHDESITFPTGFTKYNSIVIACMWTTSADTTSSSIVWRTIHNASFIDNSMVNPNVDITLGDSLHVTDNAIHLLFNFATATADTLTRNIRIVLMKIS